MVYPVYDINNAQRNTVPHMVCDSGASHNFTKPDHVPYLKNVRPLQHGPTATLPNKTVIQASHDAHLSYNFLSPKASNTLVYPQLQNESLLSIAQLCDDNCLALFSKDFLHIFKHDQLVLTGTRNCDDGL